MDYWMTQKRQALEQFSDLFLLACLAHTRAGHDGTRSQTTLQITSATWLVHAGSM